MLAAPLDQPSRPVLRDLDDPDFDPFIGDELAFGTILDPWPKIAELRERAAVHPHAFRSFFDDTPNLALERFQHFSVFGYDANAELYLQTHDFSNEAHIHALGLAFGRSISTMDPPEHGQYRRIFQKAFLPQIVRTWGDTIVDPVIDELLADIPDGGRADLVQQFTLHYPFRVIYRQLGLPDSDVKTFHKLAITQTAYYYDPAKAVEAGQKLGEYFTPLVLAARHGSGDDLVTLLAQAEVDGEYLPVEIVVSFLRQLINAGGDTTYRGTSALLTGLLSNPDQLAAVSADRDLIPQAIDEALRWEGPVLATKRMAAHDITFHGVDIPEGAIIDLVQGSANRDPARFADPDRFDIFRSRASRALAFGTGPHVCIGQHLARVEMIRALNSVLDRMPGLRLDPDLPAPEIRGHNLRVPQHIHVRYDG